MHFQYDADSSTAKKFFDGMLSNADLSEMLQHKELEHE